jgi:RsiW-degrading membrane proteinase PrsW (M82 family)
MVAAMLLGVLSVNTVWAPLHFILAEGLGGALFPDEKHLGILGQFLDNVVTIGMVEEATKIIPVLLLCLVATKMRAPWREEFAVREPLDGILLGAASGAGLALYETVHQYMRTVLLQGPFLKQALQEFFKFEAQHHPDWLELTKEQFVRRCFADLSVNYSLQGMMDARDINGFHAMANLIMRSLNDLAGHMAWAALLGYAVGIVMLKPARNWIALPVGYLLVSSLHALWDLEINDPHNLIEGVVSNLPAMTSGLLSYALLVTAILESRQISPTRAFNFATQVLQFGSRTAAPAPTTVRAVRTAAAPSTQRLMLVMGTRSLTLAPGTTLRPHEIPGLSSGSLNATVAEVRPISGDWSILGLKNLSTTSWLADTPDGQRRQLSPGNTLRIARGVRINFGSIRGQIQ